MQDQLENNSKTVFKKIESIMDKYEIQLIELLNSIKQCELEEQRILGVSDDVSR